MKSSHNVFIVLNFNDYGSTVTCVKNVLNFLCVYKIIIVDNNSNNDSYRQLSMIFSQYEKIEVIKCKENYGYAQGNNFGCRYALSKYTVNNFIIMNPDVYISEKVFEKFISRYESLKMKQENIGIVAPQLKNGKSINCGWKMPSVKNDIMSNLLFLGKRNQLNYRFKSMEGKNAVKQVDVLSGAFFLIDADIFYDVDFFDEDTFLYCEERILAYKLQNKGYKSFVFLNLHYDHLHKSELNVKRKIKAFIELNKSKKIFHKKYLKSSFFQNIIFDITAYFGTIERIIAFGVKKYVLKK